MSTTLPVMNNIQQFDFSVNLLRALLWEYNDATNLQSLLNQKNEWYSENQQQFWEDWITNVFDLRTANQFGLAVWGIILGLQLYVQQNPQPFVPSFGFGPGAGHVNFTNGNFGSNQGETYVLPIETQRVALQLRYADLTSSGTVPETNRTLENVFKNYGKAYLLDLGNMHQKYIFDFQLPFDLIYLFNNYDVLPRPAGVKSDYYDNSQVYFGFGPGAGHLNFNNAILGA